MHVSVGNGGKKRPGEELYDLPSAEGSGLKSYSLFFGPGPFLSADDLLETTSGPPHHQA